MIHYTYGSRELLLELCVAGDPQRVKWDRAHTMEAIDQGPELTIVYEREPEPRQPPSIIILGELDPGDFYAWTSTYLPQWYPLSATTDVARGPDILRYPDPYPIPFALRRPFAAVAAGEAMLELSRAGAASPTLLNARSTYSYAAVKAMVSGPPNLESICHSFDRALATLRLPSRRVNTGAVLRVWRILSELHNPAERPSRSRLPRTGAIVRAVIDGAITELLGAIDPQARPLLESLRSRSERREDLIADFDAIASSLVGGSSKLDGCGAATLALLATELSDGPLSHSQMVGEATQWDPEALLWYGFFSTYHSQSCANPEIESILVRIASDWSANAGWSRPDISVEELAAAGGGQRGSRATPITGSPIANIEISRRVVVPFRVTPPPTPVPLRRTKSQGERSERLEEIISMLRDLMQASPPEGRLFELDLPTERGSASPKPKRRSRKRG